MVNFAMHLDEFRGDPSELMQSLHKYLPEDWKFNLVFRFRLDYLSTPEYSHIDPFYLYEHFSDKLTDGEISEAERFAGKPFSLVRLMSKVGMFHYPKMSNLPDDEFLANLVLAWKKFFTLRKIGLYIAGVSDDFSSLVGLEVAKHLGVPVIFLNSGRFSNSHLLADKDFMSVFYRKLTQAELNEAYKKARELILSEKITNPELSKIVRRDFDLTSFGALLTLAKRLFSNAKTYYFEISPRDRKFLFSPGEQVVKRLKAFIRSKFSRFVFRYKPRTDEKYVFYPLHFTDDATITMKVPFIDQFELVMQISKTLPHGVYLYVKPHPHFQCSDIPLSKMRRLAKVPNIRLIPHNANTKEVISNALYSIVINSSVAFEALVMGKPVVAFGKDYPTDVVPHLEYPEQLLYPIPKIDSRKVVEYIANCYAHSIFLKVPYYLKSDFSDEADVKSMAEGIVKCYKFLSGTTEQKIRESGAARQGRLHEP